MNDYIHPPPLSATGLYRKDFNYTDLRCHLHGQSMCVNNFKRHKPYLDTSLCSVSRNLNCVQFCFSKGVGLVLMEINCVKFRNLPIR